MLIAQCTLQPDSQDGVRKQGDILVLMFPDHPWGTKDVKLFVRVEWDDPAIEAELQARRDRGEKFPVKTVPYSTGHIRQSSQTIDIADLQQKGMIPLSRGGDSDIPVIPVGDYIERTISVAVTGGIWSTIMQAVKTAWNWMVG